MKIALIAPQPFYQERGTPIAVDMLLSVLDRQGHSVDVFTFPGGEDRDYRNVTLRRTEPWVSVSDIRPGFSLKKVYLDFFLLRDLINACEKNQYDLVHAIEEGAFMALYLKRRFGLPVIYDMDSSMADQLVENKAWLRILHPVFKGFERRLLRNSDAVAPMCEALADEAKDAGAKQIFILRDVSLLGEESTSTGVECLKGDLDITGPLIMYVGNLEKYQGIDLLLESFARVQAAAPHAHLVVIGGSETHLRHYRQNLDNPSTTTSTSLNVHFVGPRPVARISGYLAQADILVSPRTKGINTPMKIYSYLHSGVPTVATDLPTHRQVLNDDIAMLTAPEPNSIAGGIMKLIDDPMLRQAIGTKAQQYATEAHSMVSLENSVTRLYEYFSHLDTIEAS